MLKPSARPVIRLRGVRQNNLKNFDLDLPLNQLIVITGLSGSGKSSLAFDTLFGEGQRRYIETFSPYARQFLDRMDKPQVDSIEGIPPAIAIEQRNAVKTTRSTVGTMTEICDYMKAVWCQLAQLHCRQCGRAVRKDSPQAIWQSLLADADRAPDKRDAPEVLIVFDLPLTEKLSLGECLTLIARQGYQRLLTAGQIIRVEDFPSSAKYAAGSGLTVVQDRVWLTSANRARFVEACEQAYHFGKGKLAIHALNPVGQVAQVAMRFSDRFHCAQCDLEYREPAPALFSFNHPLGACPTCRGFGRIISIDYNRALPDRSRTLAQGAVRPWQTGHGTECQSDLLRMCRHFEIPTNVPFKRLPKRWQDFIIEGDPEYGTDEEHHWPRCWYGIKGYFRWLESRAYKMHVRVLLSRYRAYTMCPDCRGQRFQPEALLYRVPIPGANGPRERQGSHGLTLADFYQLPIRDALQCVSQWAGKRPVGKHDPLELTLNEVCARLEYLAEVGLGYLTLDRPTRSLSGGETERVNLTTCLGTRLVNTLFVLDEPSVGLHARDTERLVGILRRLRDAGNTVVVVEHEASVMRAADQIVDLGPGHGATGGQVIFQGTYDQILSAPQSLTGAYLSGRKQVKVPERGLVVAASHSTPLSRYPSEPRAEALSLNEAAYPLPAAASYPDVAPNRAGVSQAFTRVEPATGSLKLRHATRHNLKDLSLEIPLGALVCVTGVSGSGKSTLVREVLFPLLSDALQMATPEGKASDRLSSAGNSEDEEDESAPGAPSSASLEGAEQLGRVVLVDQSILAKTPRSNPAVYIGAFDEIREFFAQSGPARQRGLNASAFSFNSAVGQCERCRGAGFEKIEMQFLSDVFIRCPDCNGRRYRWHILEVKVSPGSSEPTDSTPRAAPGKAWSIADLLDATVEEAHSWLAGFPGSPPAQRAMGSLALLQEVGLGYLKLGQPINTLSGGESQRLKLVRELAEAALTEAGTPNGRDPARAQDRPNLFLFDEPTTGLHFDDVRILLRVFQRLVNAGHSVLVIEHNLDVIKSADWIIDLGPEAGDEGGRIVAQGAPQEVAGCSESYTGQALCALLRSEPASAKIRAGRRK